MKKQKVKSIYEFSVELRHIDPLVWRRFFVDNGISLFHVHAILQIIMGWMNSHLFIFKKGEELFGPTDFDDFEEGEWEDAKRVCLDQLFQSPGEVLECEYGLGDGWDHQIKLIGIYDPVEIGDLRPRCLDGAMACPPEDCMGPPGFQHLKEVIKDPAHEEYEALTSWLNEYYPNYDPNEFSLSAVNKILNIGASKYLKLMPKSIINLSEIYNA